MILRFIKCPHCGEIIRIEIPTSYLQIKAFKNSKFLEELKLKKGKNNA